IAEHLQDLGVTKGDKVAILFPNHPEFVASFFAVIALGAVVVPVNPLLKSEEIAHIVSDSGAKLLIVDESGLDEAVSALSSKDSTKNIKHLVVYPSLPDPKRISSLAAALSVSALSLANAAEESKRFGVKVDPEKDLALIVYTSGTTGK